MAHGVKSIGQGTACEVTLSIKANLFEMDAEQVQVLMSMVDRFARIAAEAEAAKARQQEKE